MKKTIEIFILLIGLAESGDARADVLKLINAQIRQIGLDSTEEKKVQAPSIQSEIQLGRLPSELVKILKQKENKMSEMPLWKKQLIERKRERQLRQLAISRSEEKRKIAERNKPEWLKELERKR